MFDKVLLVAGGETIAYTEREASKAWASGHLDQPKCMLPFGFDVLQPRP